MEELGVRAYLEEQLRPETLDDSALDAQLAGFPSLELSFQQLHANYGSRLTQQPLYEIEGELREARILRAIASRRQLQEVLVDFWFDHFNVYVGKGMISWDISPYERLAIRPHVLGRFEDLLLAVARSPAMAEYLDNRQNDVVTMNENYARELLELHTLGVGNFSETDMVEVTRCFTGWQRDYSQPDGFRFEPSLHDQGPKSILGELAIPANGGYQDGVDVIRFLATHPATARHISRKLVVRLVSEDPPARLVDEAAAVWAATGGDLRAVARTILLSPEFLLGQGSQHHRRAKVKRPLHLLASAARVTGADPAQLNLKAIADRARPMGEDLLRAKPPTGHPDDSAAWSAPGRLLLRFNAMESVARGGEGHVFTHPGAASTEALVDALVDQYLPSGVSDETRDGAIAYVDGLGLAETAPQRAQQAATYLLSSPEFLHH